jgi:hypothetical protein
MRPILDDFLGAVPTVPAQLLLGELKRSEARATGILDSALACIVVVDRESWITEFNATAERTFG